MPDTCNISLPATSLLFTTFECRDNQMEFLYNGSRLECRCSVKQDIFNVHTKFNWLQYRLVCILQLILCIIMGVSDTNSVLSRGFHNCFWFHHLGV